jgi:DNA-binding GntR family transcriptional regulator
LRACSTDAILVAAGIAILGSFMESIRARDPGAVSAVMHRHLENVEGA